MIREVEGLAISPRSREVLLEAVGKPPPGLALILSCSVPQGSKAKFYKDLAKTARSVEFQPLSPADVPGWLMARARSHFDVELDVEAAQALSGPVNLGCMRPPGEYRRLPPNPVLAPPPAGWANHTWSRIPNRAGRDRGRPSPRRTHIP